MRDFAIKLIKTIQQIMTVPMLILFIASKNQEVIIVDVRRWAKKVELIDSSDWANLLYLLYKYPEFRSLYYYRIKQGN